jgi:hypothetical protein
MYRLHVLAGLAPNFVELRAIFAAKGADGELFGNWNGVQFFVTSRRQQQPSIAHQYKMVDITVWRENSGVLTRIERTIRCTKS